LSASGSERLLVIGADGFAGGHLARVAADEGMQVFASSRRDDAEYSCDLTDLGSLREVLRRAEPDFVANMAGVSLVKTSWENPHLTLEVNALGVSNLLEAASLEVPDAHVLCVSSGEVYGAIDEDEIPIAEDGPLNPRNPYGASKVAMEMVCAAHAQAQDRPVSIMRAFNKLGPGQADAFVASSFARQIADAERAGRSEVALNVGNLSVARDFTDVRDVARAYVLALRLRLGGAYNLCSGQPVTLETLIEHLRSQTDLRVDLRRDPALARPVDTPIIAGDNSRLRVETGWQPTTPIETSLADLLEGWRSHDAAGIA
jgi:GDP-4-dehydro-6-deoxy-D-mannose reductase